MPHPFQEAYRWIDERGEPPDLFEPQSIAEAQEWIRGFDRPGEGILIAGSGRHWHLGNNPRQLSAILSLRRCNRVVEHSPADLTATFEAGCSLRQIEEALGAGGQFLPFTPLHSPDSTIGGAVSANLTGPFAGAQGGCRDHLIGVQVLHPDGKLSKAGGKVVKNVAGYDLCKLYIGALGTLGVLTQLTFKLRPRPRCSCTLILSFGTLEEALLHAVQWRDSIFPAALEILSGFEDAAPDAPCRLAIGLLDSEAVLEWKRGRILEAHAGAAVLEQQAEEAFWESWSRAFEAPAEDGACIVRVSAPLGLFAEAEQAVRETLGAASFSASILQSSWTAVVGAEDLPARLALFRKRWTGRPVFSILWSAPTAIKRSVEVWDIPEGLRRIHQQLQSRLDPNGILNPGRL